MPPLPGHPVAPGTPSRPRWADPTVMALQACNAAHGLLKPQPGSPPWQVFPRQGPGGPCCTREGATVAPHRAGVRGGLRAGVWGEGFSDSQRRVPLS